MLVGEERNWRDYVSGLLFNSYLRIQKSVSHACRGV